MSGIIVGVDDSVTSRRAVRKAATIAEALGEELHLVMAVKGGSSKSVSAGGEQFHVDWVQQSTQFLDALKGELGIPNATTTIGGKDPAKSLVDAAVDRDASMIIVGNRRVQGAKRVLGAIATDVLRTASCDVLVAHTADDDSVLHSVSSASIFRGCSADDHQRIDALASSIEVKSGHVLTTEGKAGKEFGVLLDGSATVTVGGERVATLGAGDHFGEMALLSPDGGRAGIQSGTVTADSDLHVAVMSVQEFEAVTAEFPRIADELRRVAAARGDANTHVADD